jgi:DNA-binding MarR family transcriptional regulator
MPATIERDTLARIEDSLTTIVRQANLPRVRQRLLAEAGLSIDASAYPLLRALGTLGSSRLTELAAEVGLETSTVSRQVKSLQTAGLVTREVDPTDGRASALTLTADGIRALRKVQEARRRLMRELVADFSTSEQRMLAALLGRLADRFVDGVRQ